MSQAIPNNAFPIAPRSGDAGPQPKAGAPGFDLQLLRSVSQSQVVRGDESSRRPAATESRDDPVGSHGGTTGRDDHREPLDNRTDITDSPRADSPKADSPKDKESAEATDSVEVSQAAEEANETKGEETTNGEGDREAEQPEVVEEQAVIAPIAVDTPAEELVANVSQGNAAEESALRGIAAEESAEAEQQISAVAPAKNLGANALELRGGETPIRDDASPTGASDLEVEPAAAQAGAAKVAQEKSALEPANGESRNGEGESGKGVADTQTQAGHTSDDSNGDRHSTRDGKPTKTEAAAIAPVVANEGAASVSQTEVDFSSDSATTPKAPTEIAATSRSEQASAPTSSTFLLQRPAAELASATSASESPSTGPRVDATRFVSRVAGAFQAAEQRGGTVQIRLSPPELGAMRIELSMQQGAITAKVETETAAAKSLLLDNLPALRERLAAQDIRIEKFDVDVQQKESGSEPDWGAQQRQEDERLGRERQHDKPNQNLGRRESTVAELESNTRAASLSPDGRLNVVA